VIRISQKWGLPRSSLVSNHHRSFSKKDIVSGNLFMMPAQPEWHNEDQIELRLRAWLKAHDWEVLNRTSHSGEDIHAVDQKNKHWMLEVKGYPGTFYRKDGSRKSPRTIQTQRRTWFIEALGQIISRMENQDWHYGVVFPDNPEDPYFERHALLLPTFLRTVLNLWIFLVSELGVVRVLSPEERQFEEWANDFPKACFSRNRKGT
jgi:hypothetical protein